MSGEGTAASVAGEVLRRARESNGCPRATLGLPARGGGAAAGRGGGRATTTSAAARAAFRRLALALHPDKAKGAPGAEEAFKVANTALGRLLRELQRDEWDAARAARAAAGAEAGDRTAGGGGGGGVSEAAVQAARGAWGGGRAPRAGTAQAAPAPPSRRTAKAAGEARGPQRRSGAVFASFAGDETAFSFSFVSGADDDDFHRRPSRRTSAGGSSEDAGGRPETEGPFQDRVPARFPLGDRGTGDRNKAAGESEVSAARAVWGKKKPRLDVYSAARGVALGSRAQQGPVTITELSNGEPNAAPELQGGTCAPLRDERPGEAAARNTAAAILRRTSRQVLLAKGRQGKRKRKSEAGKLADKEPERPSGEGTAPDKGKRARKGKGKGKRKVSRTKDLGGLAPTRAVKRPTLLEQLGVTVSSKE